MDKNSIKNYIKNYLFLVIVILLILGFFIYYLSINPSKIGICNTDSDCNVYQVGSVTGSYYLCINQNPENLGGNILSKGFLLFKYKKLYGLETKPEQCKCINDFCEKA